MLVKMINGVGVTAKLAKCLSHKHKDLTESHPQSGLHRHPWVVPELYNPAAREMRGSEHCKFHASETHPKPEVRYA